jgi:hypothetical protein
MGRIIRATGAALLLLALAGAVRADNSPLALHSAMAGGGGALSAGGLTLVGAIGQPAAGALQAGAYRLNSGVIVAGAAQNAEPNNARLFLPLLRQ